MSGVYAKVLPDDETREKVRNFLDLLNIRNPVSPYDLHVTVVYSRVPFPASDTVSVSTRCDARGKEFDVFRNHDGSYSLVLKLESARLHYFHNACRELGATHDFPDFQPHLTLCCDFDPNDTIPDPELAEQLGVLNFSDIMFAPLDPGEYS